LVSRPEAERHQDEQRSEVRVGPLAGEDAAEVPLADDAVDNAQRYPGRERESSRRLPEHALADHELEK